MTNKQALNIVVNDFINVCWCGFPITWSNPLTAHHVDFKEDGGKTTPENIVPVTTLPHCGIHIISLDDPKAKERIKEYFRNLKRTKDLEEMRRFKDKLEKRIHEMGYVEDRTATGLVYYHKSIYKPKVLELKHEVRNL